MGMILALLNFNTKYSSTWLAYFWLMYSVLYFSVYLRYRKHGLLTIAETSITYNAGLFRSIKTINKKDIIKVEFRKRSYLIHISGKKNAVIKKRDIPYDDIPFVESCFNEINGSHEPNNDELVAAS